MALHFNNLTHLNTKSTHWPWTTTFRFGISIFIHIYFDICLLFYLMSLFRCCCRRFCVGGKNDGDDDNNGPETRNYQHVHYPNPAFVTEGFFFICHPEWEEFCGEFYFSWCTSEDRKVNNEKNRKCLSQPPPSLKSK